MATDKHSISRRAVIGALAAAPTFTITGAVEAATTGRASVDAGKYTIPPDPNQWEMVLTAYRRLAAEWAAHPYASTSPASPDYERLEAEEGVIAEDASQALRVVLRTAAPDPAAFVEKMEVFERAFGEDRDGDFAHLLADARRLS